MFTHTLTIYEPALTKAKKVAQSRKYLVTISHGESIRNLTLPAFCKEQTLSIMAMIQRAKKLPPGVHNEEFGKIIKSMRANIRGKYAKHGRGIICQHCGRETSARQGLFLRRRMLRDASPPGSALRARPASYFGETATPAVQPTPTTQGVSPEPMASVDASAAVAAIVASVGIA